jgi:2,4-dienoyl-CoA reductase-like NADH-dependent reductase (Old Yellow Enzyme family)
MSITQTLFTKPFLNVIEPKNRFMRSATYEALASEDGKPTERLTQYYANLAKGGVGLIVSGGVYPILKGRNHTNQLGLINDEQMEAMQLLVQDIHQKRGLIMLQLNHAGVDSKPALNGQSTPKGPSQTSNKNAAMTKDDIYETVESFVSCAKRAYAIGADGVQLHAAHGYLLGEFLSPLWNKREDEFGGDAEGRFKIVKLIAEGIKGSVPSCFPLFIKINGSDIEKGGVTIQDAVKTAKLAEKARFDCIEVSSGSGRKPYSLMGDIDYDFIFKDPKTREKMRKRFNDIHFKPAFNLEFAREIKKNVSVPIACVGGFRRVDDMVNAIKNKDCDVISLSRPFIRQPDLVNLIKEGKTDHATCVSCNRCFFSCMREKSLKCLYPY